MAEQWPEALHSLSQAKTLFKVLKHDANLAYAYQITAQVHYHQQQLPDALAAVEEAWKYAELSDSPPSKHSSARNTPRSLSALIENWNRWLVSKWHE